MRPGLGWASTWLVLGGGCHVWMHGRARGCTHRDISVPCCRSGNVAAGGDCSARCRSRPRSRPPSELNRSSSMTVGRLWADPLRGKQGARRALAGGSAAHACGRPPASKPGFYLAYADRCSSLLLRDRCMLTSAPEPGGRAGGGVFGASARAARRAFGRAPPCRCCSPLLT